MPRTHPTPMTGSAPSSAPTFTVFTPTYNRAHTLAHVYESLCAQTIRDFEWVVIDDGSSDNTGELIAAWAEQADFQIHYFKQDHAGKHIAHNLALQHARGRFFFPLDSDDGCVPNALERLLYYWNSIPAADQESFCGVGGLSVDQHGKLVGERFPTHPLDATMRERHYVYRVRGEKCLMIRTELGRRFLFPRIAGTNFVPEGVVWLEIGKFYRVRWINEVIRIYLRNERQVGDTLTSKANLRSSAAGRQEYYVWLLNNDFEFFALCPKPFLKAAAMLPSVAWLSQERVWSVIGELKDAKAKALVLAMLPVAIGLYGLYLISSPLATFLSRARRFRAAARL